MMCLKFLEPQSTSKKNLLKLNICLTNYCWGVLTVVMFLSNIKFIKKLSYFKTRFIKTGLFLSLAAYWGIILVGTFITFN